MQIYHCFGNYNKQNCLGNSLESKTTKSQHKRSLISAYISIKCKWLSLTLYNSWGSYGELLSYISGKSSDLVSVSQYNCGKLQGKLNRRNIRFTVRERADLSKANTVRNIKPARVILDGHIKITKDAVCLYYILRS